MPNVRSVLWLAGIVLGSWVVLQVLLPADAQGSWSKIGDYCTEAKGSRVDSEADANSLATSHGLTPQRSIDGHNRVQVLVYRPALLGTEVSCRITFEGSKVDIQYTEPGGLAGFIFKLAR